MSEEHLQIGDIRFLAKYLIHHNQESIILLTKIGDVLLCVVNQHEEYGLVIVVEIL